MSTTPSNIPPNRRNVAWLWFAYVGFIFIDPIFDPSLALWTITLAAVAVFALIFTLYMRCDENEASPRRYWLIAATFVLGLLVFPFNGGGSTFFIYTAAFLPFTISSTRRVLLLFLAESLIILGEGQLVRQHLVFVGAGMHVGWPNIFIASLLLLIIGVANIFFAEQKRFTQAQLRASHALRDAQDQNLALAAVAERERIARDLHDVLGHTLSVITLKAELAGRLIERDPARAAAEIADVERLARTSLSEVREAITGYRARGLAAEIEAARRTLDAAGVTLLLTEEQGAPGPDSRTWDGPTKNLTPTEETVLSLALREAVTNIVRHAHATTCTLHFVAPADTTLRRLIIEDNGLSPTPPREGNGLRGMRARIESIGGNLALESGPGTRLLITLPQS
ncbi:sensor histidine kinase [Granulicella paludicola]|uniref:sensor histidine kinase n=1 Tax=Granulicella paludicola TaxID=474951 RepID=UPI0021E0F8B0|nr:sensor histidine kinase [Granulicella paludicola]